MSPTFLPEEDLVRDLLAGHASAFATLYEAYSPALFGVLLRLVKDSDRAEDLLQDAFIKIWLNFPHYDAKQGRLFTWLLAVTRNVALDALRARKVRLSAIPYLQAQSDGLCYVQVGEVKLSQSLLSYLAPKHRTIMELIYYRDHTKDEVAKQLKLPIGTVKTRHRMALQHLKLLFKQDLQHYHSHK